MKISRIRIVNLRSFADVTIDLDNYVCLVGPNGAGKSTVLCALNIFFRETQNTSTDLIDLDSQDFHFHKISSPIEITVTFSDLSPEAKEDFKHYYRQNELSITAIANFDPASGKAQVKQYGSRLAMSSFAPFFKSQSDGKKVAELKEIYKQLQANFSDLPTANTGAAMESALREYEASHSEECIPIQSEDQFYGLSKGTNLLSKYVQWVYVPAVKDASSEQSEERNTALGKLLLRTVRSRMNFAEHIGQLRADLRAKYGELLDQNQNVLESISTSLQNKISKWAHPEANVKLAWREDPDKSIRIEEPLARIIAGEGIFEGDISRFGHGFQRSYLLALLEELASGDNGANPTLILACEEPELYQHPPQARHLAHVLYELSEQDCQVIISTHSPLFVSGEKLENLRMVRKNTSDKASMIFRADLVTVNSRIAAARSESLPKIEAMLMKVNQSLQPSLNEMFFTPRLILVEGLEDIAYITSYLHFTNHWEQYRQHGCHMVPANGKSHLLHPLIVAKELRIPTLIIFDSDADCPDNGNGNRAKHEKDNKAILSSLNLPNEDAMPKRDLWNENVIMWSSNLTQKVAEEIDSWANIKNQVEAKFGSPGDLQKNSIFIAHCLYAGWKEGKKSSSLIKVCESVINFAAKNH